MAGERGVARGRTRHLGNLAPSPLGAAASRPAAAAVSAERSATGHGPRSILLGLCYCAGSEVAVRGLVDDREHMCKDNRETGGKPRHGGGARCAPVPYLRRYITFIEGKSLRSLAIVVRTCAPRLGTGPR